MRRTFPRSRFRWLILQSSSAWPTLRSRFPRRCSRASPPPDGVFVTCDRFNLPVGMMLPLAGHTTPRPSVSWPKPRAPFPHPQATLAANRAGQDHGPSRAAGRARGQDFGLQALVRHVRSGDPATSKLVRPAALGRRHFADLNFRRQRDNEDQNILLNYGYAVLRAIVARAIAPLACTHRWASTTIIDTTRSAWRTT